MRMKFINKHVPSVKPQKQTLNVKKEVVKETVMVNNKDKKEETVMNFDKIEMAEAVLDETPKAIKKIKKDKGLIERTESSKTIINEDNKQVLFG